MSKKKNSARLRNGRDTRGPMQRLLDREANDNARVGPTDAHQTHAEFVRAKEAFRKVPVIETMHSRGQLTDREYTSLAFYRDQASLAERSPVKSCLDNSVGSGGDIPIGAAITSAVLSTARIERDLASLTPIARAVAVDDRSLSQWCIDRFGGRERYDSKGRFVAMVPVGERKCMAMALQDLKMASHRIVP